MEGRIVQSAAERLSKEWDKSGPLVIPVMNLYERMTAIYPEFLDYLLQLTERKNIHFKKIYFGRRLREISHSVFQSVHFDEPLEIPDSVTEIGFHAFQGCQFHGGITLGRGLIEIASGSFACSSLEEVVIPDSVKTIKHGAFSNCKNLKRVDLGNGVETIGKNAFYGTALEEVVIPDSVKTIEDDAFLNCKNLKRVVFGNGVETIGKNAFQGTALEEVVIPDSVKTIGDDAFLNCKNLKRVDLGNGVETIGKNAFQGAPLERIVFPDSVKLIDRQAFYECKQLVDVNLGESVEVIGMHAFAETAIEQITIPRSVNKIKSYAFATSKLQNVDFQDEKKIEFESRPFAFSPFENKWEKTAEKREQEECLQKQQEEEQKKPSDVNKSPAEPTETVTVTHESSLLKLKPKNFVVESGVVKRIALGTLNFLKKEKERLGNQFKISVVNFPDEATEIAEFFCMELGYDNLNFGEVNFGKNLKKIGKLAFRNASFDSPLVFPDSVTEIGEKAFFYCTFKNGVSFGYGLKTIGAGAFGKCKLEKIVFPENLASIGDGAFKECLNLKEVTLGKGLTYIGAEAFKETGIEQIEIPNKVKSIATSAFSGCKNLNDVLIGAGVEGIGTEAFYGAAIERIIIPSSVNNICSKAFAGCRHLTIVERQGNGKIEIANDAFYYAPYETRVKAVLKEQAGDFKLSGALLSNFVLEGFKEGKSAARVVVPECVTKIAENAFADAKVTEVVIGKNVREIGSGAIPAGARLEIDEANPCKAALLQGKNEEDLSLFKVVTNASGKELKGLKDKAQLKTITRISVPYGIRSIGAKAFKGCAKLEEVLLSDSVEEIGEGAFWGCKKLTTVSFGAQVKTIGDDAFADCAIEELKLPDSVEEIGSEAFTACKNLTTISFGSRMKTVGAHAFSKTAIKSLKIPDSVEEIGREAFTECKNLTTISFGSRVKTIGAHAFSETAITSLKLPDSVEEISEYAFYGCKNLTTVSFGSRVKTIGDDAFSATAIAELKIPDLVEIMHFTPSEFTSLKTLVLGKSTKKITAGFTLDKIVVPKENEHLRMFDGNLYDYYFLCLIATSRKDVGKTVCILESVQRIEANTFDHCENLQTVEIQSTRLEYIDDCCFIGTTPKIVRVPYKGLFAPKWVKTIFPKGVKIEKLKYSENKNSRMDKLVDSILN